MPIRSDTSKIPTIRYVLIRLHSDLFTIDERVPWWVPDEPLIPVEKMILMLEDRRFFWHFGFDCRSGIREFVRAIRLNRYGGASTIDMQFVRTATGFREKTIKRKLYEILLAMLIQFRYNKCKYSDRICSVHFSVRTCMALNPLASTSIEKMLLLFQ
jgi:transglycosylase-like protein